MRARRALKWLDAAGREYVLAAHSEHEMHGRFQERTVDIYNKVGLVLHEHEGRLIDLEDWRAKVARYLQRRGRPKRR